MTKAYLSALVGVTIMAMATASADAQRPGGHGGGGPRGGDGGPERAMMMLRAADANGDNSITRAEVAELQADMFTWMDRNGDGYLDEADQSPLNQRLAAMRNEAREEAGRDGHGERRGHHRGGEHRRADSNEDGRISRDEFMAAENPLFDRLDENGDDVITPDELDAAVERREGRRMWWRD